MKNDKTVERLGRVGGFVLDLDGTLVLGDRALKSLRPLPGAVAFIEYLVGNRRPFLIMTNGTVHTPAELTASLRRSGFPLSDVVVETPSSVAAQYFLRRGIRRVMVIGGEGVYGPIRDAGIEVLPPTGREAADAVFVGWCRDCTVENIEAAVHAVESGATLYTASMSAHFATAQGRVLGTSRIICAGITSITGRRPKVLGKPSLEVLRGATRRLGVAARDIAVVGDDPSLEMRMAHRGGALAIWVGTGLSAEHADLPADQRAHLVLPGIADLLGLMSGAA